VRARRVEGARQIQRERFASEEQKAGSLSSAIGCNAEMRVAEIRKHCVLDETSRSLMKTAMNQLQLSAGQLIRISQPNSNQ
jgi:magnesium chelatase family protein